MNNTQSTISRKWHAEAVKLVNEYDFSLEIVYDNAVGHLPVHGQTVVQNCQFCGQSIRYVAIIAGISKFAGSTGVGNYQQIGCDCLEHVLGKSWKHYGTMKSQLKTLVDAAKVVSRQKRYAEKHKDLIAWLESLPKSLLENPQYRYTNRFLTDMKRILTTGCKDFSKNMEAELRRKMADPRYDVAKAPETEKVVANEADKIRQLLKTIEEVDGTQIHERWSGYGFVNSVLTYTIQHNGATRAQLDALNKIWLRYQNKKTAKVVVPVNDPTIPY
jgi:hypothetical protein